MKDNYSVQHHKVIEKQDIYVLFSNWILMNIWKKISFCSILIQLFWLDDELCQILSKLFGNSCGTISTFLKKIVITMKMFYKKLRWLCKLHIFVLCPQTHTYSFCYKIIQVILLLCYRFIFETLKPHMRFLNHHTHPPNTEKYSYGKVILIYIYSLILFKHF